MSSYYEMLQAWKRAGVPRDMDGLHKVLMQFMEHEQAQEAFKQIGMNLPDSKPEEEIEEPVAEPEEVKREIPVGYKVYNKAGDAIEWKGAQWVSKGQIVPKKYREKVEAAAYRQMDREEAEREAEKQAALDAKAEKQRAKEQATAERYSFDDEPEEVVEPEIEPETEPDVEVGSETTQHYKPEVSEHGAMKELAARIKSTGQAEKIKNLLSKQDDIHDLAASLILRGQAEDAKAKLQG